MNSKRKNRLILVIALIAGVGLAVGLALQAFQQNMMYFFSPSDIAAGKVPATSTIRLGGLVTPGSLQRASGSLDVGFTVTDQVKSVQVNYQGILPDLFREGQGIVAIGKMQPDGSFRADQVLAKHDENYMPPEVADALKTAHNEATGQQPAAGSKSQ